MVTVESIKEKIRRMGQTYQPGNVSQSGYLYNPLPFPEFSDVPFQRRAVFERFTMMETCLPRPFRPGRLLDIGCHTGFNCFMFAALGHKCTGIELDSLTCEIARDTNELKQTGIEFINGAASIDLIRKLGHFDTILFLSTFQWVVQADGWDAAVALLAEVQKHCDVMFFETSMGQEGKMKLPQIPNAESVHALLRQSGAHSHVDCLGPMAAPGDPRAQPRLLFRSHNRRAAHTPDLWATPPEGMDRIEQIAKGIPAHYRKENAHFVSQIHRAQMKQGNEVAIKIVRPKSRMARLLLSREHEFFYALQASAFPAPIGHGIDSQRYILVLPWLAGPTLAEALAARESGNAGMLGDVARLKSALLQAQADLRQAGIRHRDLRPTNVILTSEGPRIVDFGWAAWADETDCPAPEELAAPDDDSAFAAMLAAIG